MSTRCSRTTPSPFAVVSLGVSVLVLCAGCPAKSRQESEPVAAKTIPARGSATPAGDDAARADVPPADRARAADSGQPATPDGGATVSEDAHLAVNGATEDPGPESPSPGDHSEAASPAATAGHSYSLRKEPVDPIKANGAIFEGWPQPALALLFSGEQIGFLEPCGCAGLENQKGGLKRRHTLVRQLEELGWPLLLADLGGQVKRFGPQAEIKFRKGIESLVRIGYQAIGFGPQELRLPVEQLVYVISNLPEGKNPFVSANVGLLGLDSGYAAPLRVVEAGGLRVGITSVLGTSYQGQINNNDIELLPPAAALEKVVPELLGQADVLILLSHANVEESIALAKQFPHFHLVVTAGGADEPPGKMVPIDGTKSWLIEVGHKGMYVAVVGLYDDVQTPFRYQRVPLDARFADSPEMQAMMVDYQNELATLGFEGLALSAIAHPSGRKFVGSQRCVECHTEAAAVWQNTPHAHATQTLVKLTPPRHHDPECISCHVVGWETQKYFPFESGYVGLEQTKHLHNVGCENCHGPGSDHVAAEEGDVAANDDRLEELRGHMRLLLEEGEAEGKTVDGKVVQGPVTTTCYRCHDLDNSPDFDFVKYWPHVEHQGVD